MADQKKDPAPKASTKTTSRPSDAEVAAAEQTLAAPNAKREDMLKAQEVLRRARGPRSQATQGMQTTETQATQTTGISPAGASGTAAAAQPTGEVATQRVPEAESLKTEGKKT